MYWALTCKDYNQIVQIKSEWNICFYIVMLLFRKYPTTLNDLKVTCVKEIVFHFPFPLSWMNLHLNQIYTSRKIPLFDS